MLQKTLIMHFFSGWYIVWKLFLSRFRFVRELLGGVSEAQIASDSRDGRSKVRKPRRD